MGSDLQRPRGSRCFGGKLFQIRLCLSAVAAPKGLDHRVAKERARSIRDSPIRHAPLCLPRDSVAPPRSFRSILHGLRVNSYSYASYSLPTYVQPRFVGKLSRVERRFRSRDLKQLKRDSSPRYPEAINQNNNRIFIAVRYISCIFRSTLSTFTFPHMRKTRGRRHSSMQCLRRVSVSQYPLVFCHVAVRL